MHTQSTDPQSTEHRAQSPIRHLARRPWVRSLRGDSPLCLPFISRSIPIPLPFPCHSSPIPIPAVSLPIHQSFSSPPRAISPLFYRSISPPFHFPPLHSLPFVSTPIFHPSPSPPLSAPLVPSLSPPPMPPMPPDALSDLRLHPLRDLGQTPSSLRLQLVPTLKIY